MWRSISSHTPLLHWAHSSSSRDEARALRLHVAGASHLRGGQNDTVKSSRAGSRRVSRRTFKRSTKTEQRHDVLPTQSELTPECDSSTHADEQTRRRIPSMAATQARSISRTRKKDALPSQAIVAGSMTAASLRHRHRILLLGMSVRHATIARSAGTAHPACRFPRCCFLHRSPAQRLLQRRDNYATIVAVPHYRGARRRLAILRSSSERTGPIAPGPNAFAWCLQPYAELSDQKLDAAAAAILARGQPQTGLSTADRGSSPPPRQGTHRRRGLQCVGEGRHRSGSLGRRIHFNPGGGAGRP